MRVLVCFFSALSLFFCSACGFDSDSKKKASLPDDGSNGDEQLADAFVSKWRVSVEGGVVSLPLLGGFNYDFTVDWGDGQVTAHDSAAALHAYDKAGIYTIKVSGLVEAWSFAVVPHSRDMLLSVEDLGDVGWRSLQGAFAGCQGLTAVSGGNTSSVYNMHGMFEGASSVMPETSAWDTHQVRTMTAMFMGASAANPDVGGWHTAQVGSMHAMFRDAVSADPEVSDWDTSSVTNLSNMFRGAVAADPEVSAWDTAKVTGMSNMFRGAVSADPEVSAWDVSLVTDMSYMFAEAVSANPPVSKWLTSSVRNMRGMFTRATSADPVVNDWDTSGVSNMSGMFLDAISANPRLDCWDVSKVRDMRHMFSGAVNADVDLSKWDFGAAIFMHDMFHGVTLSPNNYDGLLSRVVETSGRSNLILDAGNSRYSSSGVAARQALLARGWHISDAGMVAVQPDEDGEDSPGGDEDSDGGNG